MHSLTIGCGYTANILRTRHGQYGGHSSTFTQYLLCSMRGTGGEDTVFRFRVLRLSTHFSTLHFANLPLMNTLFTHLPHPLLLLQPRKNKKG